MVKDILMPENFASQIKLLKDDSSADVTTTQIYAHLLSDTLKGKQSKNCPSN